MLLPKLTPEDWIKLHKGEVVTLIENMPGYNIKLNTDGTYECIKIAEKNNNDH